MLSLNLSNLVKYALEGLAVAVAAFYIPRKNMNLKDIALIALTAAATFAVLDMFSPFVSVSARQGAGFGVGYNLVTGGGLEDFEEGFEEPEDEHVVAAQVEQEEVVPQGQDAAEDLAPL
jgi:hypothetical protein